MRKKKSLTRHITLVELETEYWEIVDKISHVLFSNCYTLKVGKEVRVILKFVLRNKQISFKQMDWIEDVKMKKSIKWK